MKKLLEIAKHRNLGAKLCYCRSVGVCGIVYFFKSTVVHSLLRELDLARLHQQYMATSKKGLIK